MQFDYKSKRILSLSFAITALILFIPANLEPVMLISKLGRIETASLFDIIIRVYESSCFIALINSFCLFISPVYILLSLIINGFILINKDQEIILNQLTKLHKDLRAWNMVEVFIVAIFASMIKLNELVDTEIGSGTYYFIAFWLSLQIADRAFDISDPQDLISKSRQKSFAYALTALFLLIPANLFAIMHISKPGLSHASNLFESVMELFHGEAWSVGIVVFMASFCSPWFKIFSIFYLSITTSNSKYRDFKEGLYNFLEVIGKWAMVDIFIGSLLVAIVRLDSLANVSPKPGALIFALMVIASILASNSFDHRLLKYKKK